MQYFEEKRILDRLYDEETLIKVLVATAIGMVPAISFVYALLSGITLPIILFIIPGITVGYAVKRIAKPISIKYRVIPAMVLVTFMVSSAIALPVYATYYVIALVNFGIVVQVSRRKLTKDEDNALWLLENGKIS